MPKHIGVLVLEHTIRGDIYIRVARDITLEIRPRRTVEADASFVRSAELESYIRRSPRAGVVNL